jgi:hypothetical protein
MYPVTSYNHVSEYQRFKYCLHLQSRMDVSKGYCTISLMTAVCFSATVQLHGETAIRRMVQQSRTPGLGLGRWVNKVSFSQSWHALSGSGGRCNRQPFARCIIWRLVVQLCPWGVRAGVVQAERLVSLTFHHMVWTVTSWLLNVNPISSHSRLNWTTPIYVT